MSARLDHSTATLSTRIRGDLHKRLVSKSRDEGRHIRWFVEQALERYFDDEPGAQPNSQ